jgi:hypothetical protein
VPNSRGLHGGHVRTLIREYRRARGDWLVPWGFLLAILWRRRRRRARIIAGTPAEPAAVGSRAHTSASPPIVAGTARPAPPEPQSQQIRTSDASLARPQPESSSAPSRPSSAPTAPQRRGLPHQSTAHPSRKTGSASSSAPSPLGSAPTAREPARLPHRLLSPPSRPPIPPERVPGVPARPTQPASRPSSRSFLPDAPTITCEIKWIRVEGHSEFQAIAARPDGAEALIARSPGFRWRLPVSPDATPAAAAAHENLVGQLLAAGWQRCGRGGAFNWYAERFRVLASESIEPLTAAAPPLICEIKWARVKGGSEFQAISSARDGAEVLIARSPSFRWRMPVSPDATPAAAAAHEALVRQLLAAGWAPCGTGGLLHWYAGRFQSSEVSAGQPGQGSDA